MKRISVKDKISLVLTVTVLLLILTIPLYQTTIVKAQAEEPSSDGLFLDYDNPESIALKMDSDKWISKKMIQINYQLLPERGSDDTPINTSIPLNLFDDHPLTAVVEKVIQKPTGEIIVSGNIEGQILSSFMFVIKDDILIGNIRLQQQLFEIHYAGYDLVHILSEVDQTSFPEGGEPIPVNLPEMPESFGDQISSPADSGSVIDVMVFYTPNARNAEGGTTAVLNLINLAVAETNQSYINSGIAQRLNLVHAVEISYSETGNAAADLERLQRTGDGHMDSIHNLRDTYKADIVTLIVDDNLYGNICGIAYVMTTVTQDFAPYAFNVVINRCATGYMSFAHELGHNMGARHDWYVEPGTTPYEYAHGFVYLPSRWRTIMSYNDECAANGFNCTKIPYWSNPSIYYNNVQLGIPQGQFHPADNRTVLNNSAYVVSNFRTANKPATGIFKDVPDDYPLKPYIEALYNAGYTTGCSTDPLMYCPDTIMRRAESAVFMLRGEFGADYLPAAVPKGLFNAESWATGPWAEKWAEAMYLEGLTAGCSSDPLLFCPWLQLTRLEAGVLGLRLKYGMDYQPPAATGTLLADMTDTSFWGTKWAEQALLEGILPACGESGGKPMYCPEDLVDRGWGAYVVVKAKDMLP